MVRGLPPRQTQIFLNGVPLDAASNGQFDPSLIPTGYISRVDVLEGASSVLYGPGTDAGVINIVTNRGDDGLHGGVSTEFGSDDSRHVVANLSGGNDTVNFFVSGSHTGSDGYSLPDGTLRTNSDTLRNNLFANVGVHLGDWQVGVTATTVEGHEGLPSHTIASPALNPFTTGQLFERITDLSGQSAQVDAAYQPGGPLSLRFSAYVNTLHTVEDRYDNASYSTMTNPTVQTFHEIDDMTVGGGQAQARYDFGRFGSLTKMSARPATAQEAVALRGNHNETSGWTGSVN